MGGRRLDVRSGRFGGGSRAALHWGAAEAGRGGRCNANAGQMRVQGDELSRVELRGLS
jgi:hypothetical protein